ncbi:MerR family transcriptional regulator [Clostridium sp. AL.422]|uniref:MerR family transcriptional regulator n=1 Tax=Clostridium TaxID=1485 RepID=UPI00293DA2BD|nr:MULTISPECIES: MerR family transcriptional regulator [unclassified Clostridium]MDV4151310.1 MerR family transcriptional regulator [Clostridium sp. AL.422]
MFRIGEFSQLVKVSPRMLRHYEKCGIFYPAEIDMVNGYRLYSSTQIPLLMRIISLRDMGFSINEINDIIDNYEDKDYIEEVMNRKSTEIEISIAEQKDKINRLSTTLEKVANGNYSTTCRDIVLREVPKIKVLSLREVIPNYSYQEGMWERLYSFIGRNNLYSILTGDVISIYHDLEYKEQNVDIEIGVTISELRENQGNYIFKELDSIENAATVICDGPFEKTLPEGEGVLAKWIEDNGYTIIGSERAYCTRHPGNEDNTENYQTEIQFAVKKK